MRRLLLLAAAAVLGSGCIVHDCDQRTITVEWDTLNGFTLGDGTVMGCAGVPSPVPSLNIPPVAVVDIYMDGTLVDTWNCADGGAVITNVASGTYRLTVEGLESSGRIAYRDSFDVSTASCGDRLVRAQPAEGYVNVNYQFAGGAECFGNPSYMWFSIFDNVANAVAAEVSEKTPGFETLYWCDVPPYSTDPAYQQNALYIPLPAGTYTMDWIEEHASPLTGTNRGVVGANCTPFDFTVTGGTATNIPSTTTPVLLSDTTSMCTHP